MTIPRALAAVLLLFVPGLAAPGQHEARPVSDEVAKEVVAEFTKEYRDKDFRIRLAAVDRLTGLRHEEVLRCLAKALDDPNQRVRAEAARRLGQQEAKLAAPQLRRALLSRENAGRPEVLGAVFEAYHALRTAPDLGDLKRFDDWEKEVQRQAIICLRHRRKMDTVEFLAPYLDQPTPDNVDSPTNPPASYWQQKVERWTFWCSDLHETLHDLTGQDFDEAKQVREWRKKGGRIREREDAKEAKRG